MTIRTLAFLSASMIAGAGLAQQPSADLLAAASVRLHRSLELMRGLPGCAFEASWGPLPDKAAAAGNRGNVAVFLGGGFAPGTPGSATGAFDRDLLHLRLEDTDILLAGRRMLARGAGGEWQLRGRRLHDGRPVEFLPDPQLWLDVLAGMRLSVAHREVGTFDDRPVEILGVTLAEDQVAQAVWSGSVPAVGSNPLQMALVAAGGPVAVRGAAVAPAAPQATIDLAFTLDPATSRLLRLRMRSHTEGMQMARAIVIVNGQAQQEEDEDPVAADDKSPLRYEDGLPLRPRTRKTVFDYDLRFSAHGEASVPELDERARQLTGR